MTEQQKLELFSDIAKRMNTSPWQQKVLWDVIDEIEANVGSNWHTGTPIENGWYLLECSIGDSENTYFTTDHWSDTVGYWTVNGVIRWQKIEPYKED